MFDYGFRLDYRACRNLLAKRVSEEAPARIQLLTGPRQVGKTTLLLELSSSYGDVAIYAAMDAPEAGLPGFWDRLWNDAEQKAKSKGKAILLLDEIQHQPRWASRLKSHWDRLRRQQVSLHVVATGSSALRLGHGSRESLAGRFERITLSHWSASSLVELLGINQGEAPEVLVRFGSYPGALELRRDTKRWLAYLRDAIVEPAISRDLLALGMVRRPGLVRQLLALSANLPAQIVSLQKLQGELQDPGALDTIAHYLQLLEDAYLVTGLEKFSLRALRRRAAPPKLVTLNNALLAVMNPQGVPDPVREPARFGAWVENACLAHAWNAGQRVTYWREEPFEVDGVFEGSWGTWAVEIKTGGFDAGALRGLLEFCRRNPRYRPLVLTGRTAETAAQRLGVESLAWTEFLLSGPPGL